MIDRWKAHVLAAATVLAVGCSGTTDVSNVRLTGDWVAAPGELGIATIDIALTETGGALDGNGTFVGVTGVLASGTVTGAGIHVGTEVNLTLQFTPQGAATLTQNLTGHVDDNDHFVLIFPGDQARPVTFTRQ
jgi:hypothetical protein